MTDQPSRLWIAGGRDFTDEMLLMRHAAPYISDGWELVTGAARGADLLAEGFWRNAQLPYIGVPAQWNKFGKAAGPIRNAAIAQDWNPDRILLLPGGRGTANAREQAETVGIDVVKAVSDD